MTLATLMLADIHQEVDAGAMERWLDDGGASENEAV
jgi:hypothetical protein